MSQTQLIRLHLMKCVTEFVCLHINQNSPQCLRTDSVAEVCVSLSILLVFIDADIKTSERLKERRGISTYDTSGLMAAAVVSCLMM